MIIITGGAGFIGSAMVWKLNQLGYNNIIIVDNLHKAEKSSPEKWQNLVGLKFADYFESDYFQMLIDNKKFLSKNNIEAIFHFGACSKTTETDYRYLVLNNFEYTKKLAYKSLKNGIKFIYASSAATYGDGNEGYEDVEKEIWKLKPLNMYGYSKQLFDQWVLTKGFFNKFIGLKFFNVFGPNEYHKKEMRSLVHKAYYTIKNTKQVELFKSYKPEYKDGEQKRDFIYIKDAIDMVYHLYEKKIAGGLYNIGTGQAQTWIELVTPIFEALNIPVKINFIDMPDNLKNKYQYFTEANISKLKNTGYSKPIYSIKDSVQDYVLNYLEKNQGLKNNYE